MGKLSFFLFNYFIIRSVCPFFVFKPFCLCGNWQRFGIVHIWVSELVGGITGSIPSLLLFIEFIFHCGMDMFWNILLFFIQYFCKIESVCMCVVLWCMVFDWFLIIFDFLILQKIWNFWIFSFADDIFVWNELKHDKWSASTSST